MENQELESARNYMALWKEEKIEAVKKQDFELAAYCRGLEVHYLELINLLENE